MAIVTLNPTPEPVLRRAGARADLGRPDFRL